MQWDNGVRYRHPLGIGSLFHRAQERLALGEAGIDKTEFERLWVRNYSMYPTNSADDLKRRKLKTFTIFASLVAPVLSLPVVLKALAELRSLPRINWRAEYNFAQEFAERTGDPCVAAYSEALGYRALVGGSHLTLTERKSLLTLPDSGQIIPKYLRVHRLLRIHPESPVLRWAKPRHEKRWVRNSLIYGLYTAYFITAMIGLLPLVMRYWPDQTPTISRIANDIPAWASAYLLFLAAMSVYSGVKLSVASDLVRDIASQTPLVDLDMRD
jgi:hypothetical protein